MKRRKAGRLVRLTDGKIGALYNEDAHGEKVPVYVLPGQTPDVSDIADILTNAKLAATQPGYVEEKRICNVSNLIVIGCIN